MDKENNINDELRDLAPYLFKLGKQNPFVVPGNYFEQLPSLIQNKIKQEEVFAPILSEIKKENPFQVPQNYFHSLPTIIQERITNEKESWWTQYLNLLRQVFLNPRLTLALGIVVILVTVGVNKFYDSPVSPARMEPLTYEDVSNSHYLNEIDEETLIETINSQEVSSSENNNQTSDIENYLIDNNVDVALITNEK